MNKTSTEHLALCLAPSKYSTNSQIVIELKRDLGGKRQCEQNRQKKGQQ